MKYNITVTSVENKRASMIIARQLAHDPSNSLQKAMAMAAKPPFVLFKNLTFQELQYQREQLCRLGVKFITSEVKSNQSMEPIPVSLSENIICARPPLTTSTISKTESEPKKAYTETKKSTFSLFDEQPVQNRGKTHPIAFAAKLIGVAVLIIAGFMVLTKKHRFEIKPANKMLISYSGSMQTGKISEKTGKKAGNSGSRKKISAKAKKESDRWADSAEIFIGDYLKAVNFYKIAISFNKYNIHAWFGLLNAYHSASMIREMEQTRKEMEKIFGESIFSVNDMVKPLGKVIDVYTTGNGAFRVEYKTGQSTEQAILSETYTLAKAFREICECKTISIFALTAPGRGMVVHLSSSAPLLTLESFKSSATINFLK